MASLKAWTVVGAVRVDGLRTALGKLQGFREAAKRAAQGFARRFKNLAKTIGVAWTAAMGAATAATVGFAAKTERQFSELAKLTNEQVGSEIGRAIQSMGESLPVARSELFETAEAALRLGVRGTKNVKEFTKVIGQVGVATDIAAGEAAEIMARFAAATETPISKVRNLASVVNELSNTLPRSFSQILQAAQRAGPQLSRLGSTATEISTMSGVLTSVSASAQRAGTRLRRLGQELTEVDKVKDIAEGFKAIGVEGFASMVENNPTQAIVRMAQAMRRGNVAAQAITQTLSSSSRQALAGMAQRLPRLRKELGRMNEEFEAGTSIQEEFNKFVDDLISKWTNLKTTLINVAAGVGEHLLPVFKDLVKFIQNNAAEIGVIVSKGMATSLDAMLSAIRFVKGSVKAIGFGGLIGFLFFGAKGAALGGLIAKVINENIALLKQGANDIVTGVGFDKLFDLTTAEQARVKLKRFTTELATLSSVREKVAKHSEDSTLPLGSKILPHERMILENRGIPISGQGGVRPKEHILGDIDTEMRTIIQRSDELRQNFESIGESAEGPLSGVLERLDKIVEKLDSVTTEDINRYTGDQLTRAEKLVQSYEELFMPGMPEGGITNLPTPRGAIKQRFHMGLQMPGQMQGLGIMPPQFRPGRKPPGQRPYSPPAASIVQRMRNRTRIGRQFQVRQAGLGDDAGSDAIGAAIEQGMMVDQQKFTNHVLGVIDEGTDEAGQRGAQLFRQLGQQLMAGLASGTFDAEDFLKRAFMQVIQLALFSQSGGLTAALGIASPAKATMFIGESLVEGIAEGVKSQQGSLQKSMRGVKDAALGEMDGIAREANQRVRGVPGRLGSPLTPEDGSLINFEISTKDLPEAENPLEEKYQQKTRVWLEEKARQLREDGVPEFQPPQ